MVWVHIPTWSGYCLRFIKNKYMHQYMVWVHIPICSGCCLYFMKNMSFTPIWFGCTSLYGQDTVYISWKIRLCTQMFWCTSLYGRGIVNISRKINLFTHICFGCTSLYNIVGMLFIFHEKYVFVPIYGLGAHPYMVEMLFIFHEK